MPSTVPSAPIVTDSIGTERRTHASVAPITSQSASSWRRWLVLPPSDSPRPLRDDLAVKLLVRTAERPADVLELVRKHRASYLRHLSRLNRRRARLEASSGDGVATRLLLLQADVRVRSDLAWLEIVEKEVQKLDARGGAGVTKDAPRR